MLALRRAQGSAEGRAGRARFGIQGRKLYGVPGPKLEAIARTFGRNHSLAMELRRTGVFEARTLAALVEEPRLLTAGERDGGSRSLRAGPTAIGRA